jgi:hypothetical protein
MAKVIMLNIHHLKSVLNKHLYIAMIRKECVNPNHSWTQTSVYWFLILLLSCVTRVTLLFYGKKTSTKIKKRFKKWW